MAKAPVLQPDFAMVLLEKELELEATPSLELLDEVVQLYSQAVEYYEHCKDSLARDFQEKMHKLLVRPEILRLMNMRPAARSQASSPVNIRDRKRALLATQFSQRMAETPQVNGHTHREFTRFEKGSRVVTTKAISNVQAQEVSLAKRLAERKRTLGTFSFRISPRGAPSNFSFDSIESTEEESRRLDVLETQLEALMEKHSFRKVERLAAIKFKYEVEMRDFEEDALLNTVKLQMQRNMQEELNAASKELDEQLHTEIQKVKDNLLVLE